MRAPVDHIFAPPFPPRLQWLNARRVHMHELRGRAVLVEFWDFCRANSLRTLPYVKAWHERYATAGLSVLGIHSPGFEPSRQADAVRAAVARLAVHHPVAIDSQLEVWREYENLGWPARYLFDRDGRLFDYHYGEGAYAETEAAICELLGISEPPAFEPLRPEDAPGAELERPSDEVAGPYSGPYVAGGVWAVLDGRGAIKANGRTIGVGHPGAYELICHQRSTHGELRLEVGDGVKCHAVCFTPGVDVGERYG
jgi:hypothetical protein